MKLKNLLLAATTPFLLNCSDLPTAQMPTLRLEDYTCADEACSKVDKKITHDYIRPLRFISVASYPGVQNYRWDVNWKQNLPDGSVVDAKVWIEADQQVDHTTVTWNLADAPKVEYVLTVKVQDQMKEKRWRPIDEEYISFRSWTNRDIEKIIEVPLNYKVNSQTTISNPKKR